MDTDNQKMRHLAQQLSQPHGTDGVQVGHAMHESNIGMTRACFASLVVAAGDALLEIGHGNGMHMHECFAAQPAMYYQGLELSVLMRDEALHLNHERVKRGDAGFAVYDGSVFPFADGSYEKAMTVNTIYLLPEPIAFLKEIHRVLKPMGRFSLAFVPGDFMCNLPFVQYGFKLYQVDEVLQMLVEAGFQVLGTDDHEEWVPSKAQPGTTTHRPFTVVRAARAQ